MGYIFFPSDFDWKEVSQVYAFSRFSKVQFNETEMHIKQDIYVFLVKNLDLDSY